MFCSNCGEVLEDKIKICIHCGVPTSYYNISLSKTIFILLGVLFGGLGAHNFYIGNNQRGVIQLLINFFLGWLILPGIALYIWVIYEVITVKEDATGQPLV